MLQVWGAVCYRASMTNFNSAFLSTLSSRGYVKQITHPQELDAYCGGGVPVAYIGFDATADSLHVGSLVQIMMLRHLQKSGGKPIVLMGGGTTKVGDPTDKDSARPILTEAQILANMAGIKSVFETYLQFGDGPTDAIMVNNDDWLGELKYLDFLREIGPHFTINKMIAQDTVARRLKNEQPYTFLEFNYMLLQSYDYAELYRRHACRLQLGGSDQWGNIVNGVELTRRVAGGEAYGLTTNLVTTASGAKMGKTADGAVWLNADKRSPYEYWQFWRNTEDADVGRFLRLFTELPLDAIAQLEALEGASINDAKVALANEATTMLHGADAAAEAEAASRAVFAGGGSAAALPSVTVTSDEIAAGYLVAAAFTALDLTKTNGDARRLVKQNAAKLNDVAISDPAARLSLADFVDGEAKLSAGKKKHGLVRLA